MLIRLSIENYAIIDKMEVDFSNGLNIITGETGAGKSILMGALGLILGNRADSSMMKNSERKCIVEGFFSGTQREGVNDFFMANELDAGQEIILRRELGSGGKSRAFINDTPVNLNQLKQLGAMLVDLHQQFDTLEINSADFQRSVVDAMAENTDLLLTMKNAFSDFHSIDSKLKKLITEKEQAGKEWDYQQFLFDEISELDFKANELELLDQELKLLGNAESIKQQLIQVLLEFSDGDHPLVNRLKSAQQTISGLHDYNEVFKNLHERLTSVYIELKDISDEIRQAESGVHLDENRILWIQDRLSAGYKLLKKHGLKTTSELLSLADELQEKLSHFVNMDAEIEQLQKDHEQALQSCNETASRLQARRRKCLPSLISHSNQLLAKVGMPNAKLQVELQETRLGEFGADQVLFLFDANKSGKYEPVSKVASGGELSRLMLIIKSLVAQKLELPTLIFDEIDSGISGEAARQVGLIMKSLATAHQLISITHQPQIAALADQHLFVFKQEFSGIVQTSIRQLDNSERVNAIAKMISGEKPTAAALANAKELMGDS